MWTILAAMSMAAEAPRVVTLPQRARPAATAVRKRPARRVAGVRRKTSARLCVTGTCSVAAASPYRLTGVQTTEFSGKLNAVRSTGMPCGLQGAPVCPSKGGQKIVQTAID